MKTFILALFGLLALVNAAPQNFAGYPYAYPQAYPYKYEPASHENTKDKREANPEAWELQEEDGLYGEPRRAHAGAHPEPIAASYRRPGPPPKRSANDFSGLNIVQWISMLQDIYEKFDYSDPDCQKRMICEVMKEPEYYGNHMARNFKSGFQMAKYHVVLSLSDDMRELLDEYNHDANSRPELQKGCEEFFHCPYSSKDLLSLGNGLWVFKAQLWPLNFFLGL